jgi:hypothetical protein
MEGMKRGHQHTKSLNRKTISKKKKKELIKDGDAIQWFLKPYQPSTTKLLAM